MSRRVPSTTGSTSPTSRRKGPVATVLAPKSRQSFCRLLRSFSRPLDLALHRSGVVWSRIASAFPVWARDLCSDVVPAFVCPGEQPVQDFLGPRPWVHPQIEPSDPVGLPDFIAPFDQWGHRRHHKVRSTSVPVLSFFFSTSWKSMPVNC